MDKIKLRKIKVNEIKWKNRIIYVFVYTLIIAFMVLINMYTGKLGFLDSSNAVFIAPSEFNEDYSVIELTHEDKHVFNYTIDLADESFINMEGEEYKVIINGIKDNAIKVWFNDHLIISEGDLEDGRSLLRSGHVYGSVESSAIKDINRIKVQTYADYRTGIDDSVIISEKKPGERAVRLLKLFNEQFIYIGFGFMIMSVFFLLISYLLNRSGNKLLLLLSLATFFMSFYFFDFLPISYLEQKYIFYKKIYLLFLSLGIYFYGKSLYEIIGKKYIMLLPKFQLIYYIIIMLLSKDMIQFKMYYNYFYYSLLIMVLVFLLATIFNVKKNNKVFILLLHFLTIIFLAILSSGIILSGSYFSIALPVFIMFTVSFLPMIMTFDLLLETHLEILAEQNLKDIAYKQSMVDGLTGVWNKRYLESRLYDLSKNTVIALVDLDNLKAINDTYGHLAGDRTLTYLADTMQSNLREDDDVCRYGGDEFVVIFENCSMEQAVNRIEQIRKLVAKNSIQFNDKEINTTISAGLCAVTDTIKDEKVIECADRKLYIAKEKGRNRTEYLSYSK